MVRLPSATERWSESKKEPLLTPFRVSATVACLFVRGLSNGVASAMICRDLILGVKNSWFPIVDARRWSLKAVPGAAEEGWHTAKHFISDKIKAKMAPDVSTLQRGQGGVVKIKGESVGAYLDMDGKYHLVKPVCTHLGCNIVFNQTDRTWSDASKQHGCDSVQWSTLDSNRLPISPLYCIAFFLLCASRDCPCHGSQFDIDGRVIHGPACKNLCKRDDLKW